MATCIHSSPSCLPPFYTIPIFPLLNRKFIYNIILRCAPVRIYSGAHGMVGGAAARVVSVFWRPGGLYSEPQTAPAVFMKFFRVFFLLLLLGGDYGLEPASLGAFPTQTRGCDGRANILFAAAGPKKT